MKLYHNLCEAVIQGLEVIFTENKYADKVIEKTLRQNPKWGARDRRFIAETTYDIVRWHRLFSHLTDAGEHDFWKLLGTWCLWNKVDLPNWDEFKGLDRKKIQVGYEEIVGIRKIRYSREDIAAQSRRIKDIAPEKR